MQYRYLGSSGLQVSLLSFGAWVTFANQISDDTAADCMKAAREAGVNFFDNAEAYAGGKAEVVMGNVIKKLGWKRSDVVVSTKIFWGGEGPNDRGLSRKHIIEGTNASLARLQVDYVDLLFCHRPDINTPIEETVRAMNMLINEGKTFYWGTSEWSAEQIMEAVGVARREHLIGPAMEQPQYNMFCRDRVEAEHARLDEEIGLGWTIGSPLASGLLTGKHSERVDRGSRFGLEGLGWLEDTVLGEDADRKRSAAKALGVVANDIGLTPAQLALAWCAKNPNVSSVITGASKVEQVIENMKAVTALDKLDAEVMTRIEGVLGNKPLGQQDFR